MREATLSVAIRLPPSDERDIRAGGEINIKASPSFQVADDRDRTETSAAASRIPRKVALKETSILSREKGAFVSAVAIEDDSYGRRAEDHVTFVELRLELIPSLSISFLFRVSPSPSNI
jgi:hypothetical protein